MVTVFGLSIMACVAIVAVTLTAVVQINNIVRQDKRYQKRIAQSKKKNS